MNRTNVIPLEVTEENFGDVLIGALEEAVAFHRGEGTARVRVRHRTPPDAVIAPASSFDAAHVRAVRMALAQSQALFARTLNVSIQTVQAWERGARSPSGPSLRLLEVAERHPDALRESLTARQAKTAR